MGQLGHLWDVESDFFQLVHLPEDFFGSALHDDFTFIEYNDPVCVNELIHIMGNVQHGHFLFFVQFFDGPHDFFSAGWVEHGGRLIKNDAVGFHGQYAGNGDPLLLSA